MKKCLLFIFSLAIGQVFAQWTGNTALNNAVCSFNSNTGKTGSVICSDGNGGAFVAWVDARDNGTTGNDIYIQRINANGSLVFNANGLLVCNAAGGQSNISITPDGNGGAFLVWQDPRVTMPSPINLAYAQRVSATGSLLWATNGVAAFQTLTGSQTVPTAVVTSLGEFFVVTRDARNANTDLFVQKLNATTGAPLLTNDLPIVTQAGNQSQQQVATDTSGNFVIVWSDPRTPGTTSNQQIYTQKVNANGTVAWAADGLVVCSNLANNRLDASISFVNSINEYVISWSDLRAGTTNTDIYAQRISNLAGAPFWTVNGVAVCAATGSQSSSQIRVTSDNAAIVSWIDPRNSATTNNDIYAHKIKLSDGSAFSTNWLADGTVVCNVATSQTFGNSSIIPNHLGGAYFVWSDPRTGGSSTPNDIYTLSLNGDASITSGWIANGNIACTAAGSQTTPNIVASSNNRFIVTWQDARNATANGEIYASRFETNGLLPIQLTQLVAKRDNENIVLSWETINENNYSHYEVEKLNTNNSFINIGNVVAKNKAANAYAFTNNKAGKGVHLYRLKMVDATGKFAYSNTVRVDIDGLTNNSLSIYPNPVKSYLQFTFNASEAEKFTLQILSAEGKMVKTQVQQMAQGYNTISVPVNDLLAGNYILQVLNSSHKKLVSQVFVK